ncbi:hypothetical protein NH340_JMT02302 [Sarcoptes scabiei]|nr:hypothetical protein NH340_JMT02302 [Sarcoptes scabiei]
MMKSSNIMSSTSNNPNRNLLSGSMLNVEQSYSPNHISMNPLMHFDEIKKPMSAEQNLERLFNLSPIEIRDDFEDKLCRCYLLVQNQIVGKSPNQIQEELSRICRENPPDRDHEIVYGIVISMLLDFYNTNKLFLAIIPSIRDGSVHLCNCLNQILSEKFSKLHDHARQCLLLLCKELLRNPMQNIEIIFYNLMRNIVSGDISNRNLALCETILDILIEHRPAYENNILLIQYSLFKFLRLIADHANPSHQRLLIKEIRFCNHWLTERFSDLIPLGRDLIRLLQQVSRITEFEQLWRKILTNPTSLSPKFSLVQMLKTRTNRRFIRLLITFDIEKKLNFLVSQVRLGSQRRYQEWFQKQYFSTSENQMLRSDLIRFICNSIHPSNEIIASDLMPRWAMIGWIINTCSIQCTLANCRLALFYDWLMFDVNDVNNNLIMDLEPGLLVMYFSLKGYTSLTNALLDFICRIPNEFYPPLVNQIKMGFSNSIRFLLEKRVVPNLSFMFDPNKIDQNVKQLLIKYYPEFQSFAENINMTNMLVGQQNLVSNSNSYPPMIVQSQTNLIPNGHFLSQQQKSTNVLNQTHPATLIGGIPGLNMTFDSETSKHLGSTSIQSTFSDDEDESIGNDGQIKVPPIKKFKKNMIPSTNSSQPISSLKQPRPNRLPSFSSGNNNVKSNVTIGSTSTMITPQTLASNLSNINYKTSNVSPVKTIATNNQNASEYIANILNSTVMNISSANNNCGPVQHPPQSSHHQQDINSTHYVVTNTVPVIVTSDEFKNGNLKTDVKHVNGMTTVTSVFDSASPIVSSLDSGTISSEVLIIDDISQDSVLSSSSLDSSLQYRSFTVPLTSDHDVIVSDQLEFQKSVNEEELIQNIESIKDETIKKHLMLFHNKRSDIEIENFFEILSKYEKDTESEEFKSIVVKVLGQIFSKHLNKRLIPVDYSLSLLNWLQPDEQLLKESIWPPVRVMLSYLLTFHDKTDSSREASDSSENEDNEDSDKKNDLQKNESNEKMPILREILTTIYNQNESFGHLLLLYLRNIGKTKSLGIYCNLMRSLRKKPHETCVKDLQICANHDYFVMFLLIPVAIKAIPSLSNSNLKLLNLILTYADFNAIHYLCFGIMGEKFSLFQKDSLQDILVNLSNYDHIQQSFFWDLLKAHEFPIEIYISLAKQIENGNNQFLINHIVQSFKCLEPTSHYFKLLINRDQHKIIDLFIVNILMFWVKKHEEKLSDIIANYVSSIISSPTKRNKRTTNNVSKNHMNKITNIENLLYYLEEIRKKLLPEKTNDFFGQERLMFVILDQLKQICTSQQKIKYAELFVNVPDDNDNGISKNTATIKRNISSSSSSMPSQTSNSLNKKGKKALASNSGNNNSETESDSSEEEEPPKIVKASLRNKKRKPQAFDSD